MSQNKYIYDEFTLAELEHMAALQRQIGTDALTRHDWDERAASWESTGINALKGEERITGGVELLEKYALLQSDFCVADIGCGTGKFLAAFSNKVKSAVGFDISKKMLDYAKANLDKQNITNVELVNADFHSLDAKKYAGRFDLVFASLTPALSTREDILRATKMSRSHCCCINHIFRQDSLSEQIKAELFPNEPMSYREGMSFYTLFNTLFLMGYMPKVEYQTCVRNSYAVPSEEYANHIMSRILPPHLRTKTNRSRILMWLMSHKNEEGKLVKVTKSKYAAVIWSENEKAR